MLLIAAGITVAGVALADVFGTALNYDGFGFLSSRVQRIGWKVMRAISHVAPGRMQEGVLSVAGPMLLPLSVAVWATTTLVGFALVYLAGMNSGGISLEPGLEPSLGDALYMSGVTLTTVGYGDATPTSSPFQVVAVAEGLVGFAILTLVVSYVTSTFGVLASLSRLSDTLRASDADNARPETALRRYFRDHAPAELSPFLQQVRTELSAFRSSLRRYPIAYYFHPRDVSRSLPFSVAAVSDIVATLRFATDDRSVAENPWLLDLDDELHQVVTLVADRFVPFDVSSGDRAGPGTDSTDGDMSAALVRFGELETLMAELLGREASAESRPDRFEAWYRAALRRDSVTASLARDLGYEPDDLPDPLVTGGARLDA